MGDSQVIVENFSSFDGACCFIQQHETEKGVSFVINKTDKEFRKLLEEIDVARKSVCVRNGFYCKMIGKQYLYCKRGHDRHIAAKERYKQKVKNNEECMKKSRVLSQPTIKVECPAKLVIMRYVQYDNYKFNNETAWHRQQLCSQLKREALDPGSVTEVYEVQISTNHTGHPLGKKVIKSDLDNSDGHRPLNRLNKRPKKLHSDYLRDLCKEISTLSHLVPEEAVHKAIPKAEEIVHLLKKFAPKNEGRSKVSVIGKVKKEYQSKEKSPSKYKKCRKSGQVGKAAESEKLVLELYDVLA